MGNDSASEKHYLQHYKTYMGKQTKSDLVIIEKGEDGSKTFEQY
jgi:hypothetical protein